MLNALLRRATPMVARLRSDRHGTILCFHGVEATDDIAPSSAHVSVDQFRECIDVVCAAGEAVPLSEMVARHAAGRSTAGLFSLTFDDAYVSLATDVVRAILRGGQLPITIFVVTAASERGSTFWWDRVETLERVVAKPAWKDFERSIGLPDAYRTPLAATFGPLRPLRQWVLERFAGRWPSGAESALKALEASVGSPHTPRAMTFDELEALMRRAHVEIGVHTVTHPVLPMLSDDEARDEIGRSFSVLRERWPSTLPWLAAPFGQYDHRTSRLAREAGLEGVLSLHAFDLSVASRQHGLPRVNIMENAPAWKLGLRMSGLAPRIWKAPSELSYPPLPAPD